MNSENKYPYRVILIPPNNYDTVKVLGYKTENEMNEWFKNHVNNPTISNHKIIIEKPN